MEVLQDKLGINLKVVFCGTAVGAVSARLRQYYANRGNQFWAVLFRTGLTPRQVLPEESNEFPMYGIGFTDLVKHISGTDDRVAFSKADIDRFHRSIMHSTPAVLAFNGKKAAKEFYGGAVAYGLQPESAWIGRTAVYVLPSTSGAARKYWKEEYWRQLADFVKGTK